MSLSEEAAMDSWQKEMTCNVLLDMVAHSGMTLMEKMETLEQLVAASGISNGPGGISFDRMCTMYAEANMEECEAWEVEQELLPSVFETYVLLPVADGNRVEQMHLDYSKVGADVEDIDAEKTVGGIFESITGVPSCDSPHKGVGIGLEELSGIVPDFAVDHRGDSILGVLGETVPSWMGAVFYDAVFGAGKFQVELFGCDGCGGAVGREDLCGAALEGYEVVTLGIPGVKGFGCVASNGFLLGIFPVYVDDPSVAHAFARSKVRTECEPMYELHNQLGHIHMPSFNFVATWRPDVTNRAIVQGEHGWKDIPTKMDRPPSLGSSVILRYRLSQAYRKLIEHKSELVAIRDADFDPGESYLALFKPSSRGRIKASLGSNPTLGDVLGNSGDFRLLSDLRYYTCSLIGGGNLQGRSIVDVRCVGVDCMSDSFLALLLESESFGAVSGACWFPETSRWART